MRRWQMLWLCGLPLLTHAADPAPLGRLFLTPGERAALEAMRQNSPPPGAASETQVSAHPIVTLQGYVRRSDGKGTVWIDGQPAQEASTTGDIEIGRLRRNANSVPIKLPNMAQPVELKAGQRYDPASGNIAENIGHPPNAAKPKPAK